MRNEKNKAIETAIEEDEIRIEKTYWHKVRDRKPRMYAKVFVSLDPDEDCYIAELVNEGNSWQGSKSTFRVEDDHEWAYSKGLGIEADTRMVLEALLSKYDKEELIVFLEHLK